MNTPENFPFRRAKRPVTKATMDQPQEEFIADEASTAKEDERKPQRATHEPESKQRMRAR